MATKQSTLEYIRQLRLETGSNDPYIAENARQILSKMGRAGGKVARKRRVATKQDTERKLKKEAEDYRRASRGS